MPPIQSSVWFASTKLIEIGNYLPVYGFEVGVVVAVGLKIIAQCVPNLRNDKVGENIDVTVPGVVRRQPVQSAFVHGTYTRHEAESLV